MNKNWRTNLGGAISVTGTSMIAVGILPQLGGLHSNILWWIALVGFILSCVGKGLTALFAADVGTVKNVAVEVDRINQLGSDPNSVPLAPNIPVKPNPPKI